MKTITMSVMLIAGLTLGHSTVWAEEPGSVQGEVVSSRVLASTSVDDHMALARAAKEKFDTIENKIEELQTRIDKLSQKPYLDTKGFKRQGLELWKGKLVNQLRKTGNEIVWHENQAKEMLALQNSNRQDS